MNDYLSKVGILLVVTNEADHLSTFCNSLLAQNYIDIKLFVLDNNCTDCSIEIIKSFFSECFVLHSKENAGFAKGNNWLAEEAIKSGCELLFILNPDIELHENCINSLVKLINRDERISAVAPIMFFGRDKKHLNKIQCYVDNIDFKNRHITSPQADQLFIEGKYPKEIEVNVVSGGITFIKSSVVQEIGLFDDRYFIYGEEADLAFRSYRAGYKMMVTSDAKVWHHHDWSPKNNKQYCFSYYYMNRAKILYYIKFKLNKQLIIYLVKELYLFPVKVRWSLKTADLKLLKYYYLGFLHGLLNKHKKSSIIFR
jgi:hypothetical protein